MSDRTQARCPWCGDPLRAGGGRDEWFTVCDTAGCHAIGPIRPTPDDALDAMRRVTYYNRRTA